MSLARYEGDGIEHRAIGLRLAVEAMQAISIALYLKAVDGAVDYGHVDSSGALTDSQLVNNQGIRFSSVFRLECGM
jgi:hypothetical protein